MLLTIDGKEYFIVVTDGNAAFTITLVNSCRYLGSVRFTLAGEWGSGGELCTGSYTVGAGGSRTLSPCNDTSGDGTEESVGYV